MPGPNPAGAPQNQPPRPAIVPASPPAAPHPQAPASAYPPSLIEIMEGSFYVLIAPHSTFAAFAARPAPEFHLLAVNVVLWSAIGSLLGLAMGLMSLSTAPGIAMTLVLAAAGTIGGAALSLAAAGLLHLLATLSGGKGDFERSGQIVSLSSALLPLAAVLLFAPLPLAWIAPTVLGAWLAVRGVESLHGAPEGQAWLVIGTLGAALAAVQFVFHKDIEAAGRDFTTRATLMSNNGGRGAENGAAVVLDQVDDTARRYGLPPERAAAGVPGIRSGRRSGGSMDMVRRASENGAGPQLPALRRDSDSLPDAQQIQQMSQGMIEMVNQQLNANPEAMRNLPPEQRANLQRLLQTANQANQRIQRAGPGGKRLSEGEMTDMLQDMLSNLDPQAQAEAQRHIEQAQKPPR